MIEDHSEMGVGKLLCSEVEYGFDAIFILKTFLVFEGGIV